MAAEAPPARPAKTLDLKRLKRNAARHRKFILANEERRRERHKR
jgi:hypothetical protein